MSNILFLLILISSLCHITPLVLSLVMSDPLRSPTSDFYSILGITKSSSLKDIRKAYKFLISKWHPDKNPSNKKEAEANFNAINDAYDKAVDFKRLEKEPLTISEPILLDYDHHKSVDDEFFSRNVGSFAKSLSRRSKTPTPSSFSRCTNKSTTPTFSRHMSQRVSSEIDHQVTSPLFSREATKNRSSSASLSSKISTTTPILYSQSVARRKQPPVQRKLQCTLEELLNGCVKKFKITRDVIKDIGIVQEEEILKINVKPGWKKGTTIMFEGKGDEKPGHLPADIVFLIDEHKHPLFIRDGDDLELTVKISLVQALTGCSILVPLLGGENMSLSFDEVIYPGFEEVIRGQGMPNPRDQGRRGRLRVKFLVEFPKELSDEQRSDAVRILQDC